MELTEKAKQKIRLAKITHVGEYFIDLDNGITIYLDDREVSELCQLFPDDDELLSEHKAEVERKLSSVDKTISVGSDFVMSTIAGNNSWKNVLRTERMNGDYVHVWSYTDPKNCGWFD